MSGLFRPLVRWRILATIVLAVSIGLGVVATTVAAPQGRFFPDDPIAVDPDTEDASGAAERDIDLLFEFIENLFMDPGEAGGVAGNINTVDEVPDSSWFTNRIGIRSLTTTEIARGPDRSDGPSPGPWRVERGKTDGIMPGIRILDAEGVRYFVKFDSPGYRELATGAEVVVTKLLHALGYHVPENYIAYITRDDLVIAEGARKDYSDGRRRPLVQEDLDLVLSQAAREPDGSYRVVASKALEGSPIGGFRFHGTRPDDPNDIVPHEARRELRALRVFSAWVNHVDCKGSNTLDTIVPGPNGSVVRHHLIDFGSTLGSAGVRAREAWEGAEFVFDQGETRWGMVDLGLRTRPWMHAGDAGLAAVGRFEAERFDPEGWKPRLPNPAFARARPEDLFWGARLVAAFTDEQIRAAVEAGRYSDPDVATHLADTLIARRDLIARAWLNVVNPLVDVALDASGVLTFDNAAVRAGVAAEAGGYRAEWARYDDTTGAVEPLGTSTTDARNQVLAPAPLPTAPGALVRVDLTAVGPPHPAWAEPLRTYFRRTADGWQLVGLDRAAR